MSDDTAPRKSQPSGSRLPGLRYGVGALTNGNELPSSDRRRGRRFGSGGRERGMNGPSSRCRALSGDR